MIKPGREWCTIRWEGAFGPDDADALSLSCPSAEGPHTFGCWTMVGDALAACATTTGHLHAKAIGVFDLVDKAMRRSESLCRRGNEAVMNLNEICGRLATARRQVLFKPILEELRRECEIPSVHRREIEDFDNFLYRWFWRHVVDKERLKIANENTAA